MYEERRVKFFKLEDSELKKSMGDKQYEDLKTRMQNNSLKLLNQSDQLDRTKALGVEAHQNLQSASKELHRQGTELLAIREKNYQVGRSLQRSERMIKTMSYRIFKRKALMCALAFLLLLIDVGLLYWKLFLR